MTRRPRARQRFPGGGKNLYELLRMDHEPVFIGVWPESECLHPGHSNTLTYEPAFDPMLYFWPIERQHVIVFCRAAQNEDDMKRLAKALKRDGAELIQFVWSVERTLEERQLGAPGLLRRVHVESFEGADAVVA